MQYIENQRSEVMTDLLETIQARIMTTTSYFGIKTLKNPCDFWVYQEIIFDLKPDYIVEIGNFRGGSALALAHLCDSIGKGQVIGLDINQSEISDAVRAHPRLTFIEGDACDSFAKVKAIVGNSTNVLIIEDSSHTYENTLNVLRTYQNLISRDGYFIVEDSICYHGLDIGPNPGPYEAIEAFTNENTDFSIDRTKESFLITWNPKGYLRRIK
jgi:cephalosporin hydroxylase